MSSREAAAAPDAAAGRVRPLVKVAYGLPACALAAVGIPLYVHLPKFYTDVVGVNVAVLGLVLVLLRLVDAVTDPLIGLASDRTRSRFGRRRPYIAFGALPTALAVYLLFTPPAGAAATATVWFAVWLFVLYLCWTIVAVPYESLAPELTFDYDERTTLLGVREALLIVGTLLGAIVPGLVRTAHGELGDPVGERATFQTLGMLAGPLIVATCWWCVASTREQPLGARPAAGPGAGIGTLLARYRETLANRPFVILLSAYTVSAIGGALPATLIFYYVEYVLRSTQASLFLAIYFVVGFLCLPPWVAAARRFGKKQAWLAAMAINTGAFIGVFLLQPGQAYAYGVLVAVSGIGFGATLAIPSSMQADVIDYDELLCGRRREGQYIGLWSIAKKAAGALGVGVALPVLDWAGYAPNVEQSPAVILTLRTLYAGVPCLCNVVAFLIATAYPIDRRRHTAIRDATVRRLRGDVVADPLVPGRLVGASA